MRNAIYETHDRNPVDPFPLWDIPIITSALEHRVPIKRVQLKAWFILWEDRHVAKPCDRIASEEAPEMQISLVVKRLGTMKR